MEKKEKWLIASLITIVALCFVALLLCGLDDIKRENKRDRLEQRRVEALETIAARCEDIWNGIGKDEDL